MTAEVAVMNRQAVALAADSAITVSSVQGSRKSWPSASKIFAMPQPHSVALMIYGSTSFHRLPWDTVIKEFAKSLPDKPLRYLGDYTTQFLRFLRSHKHFYPPEEQDLFVFAKLVVEYLDLRQDIEDAIDNALEDSSTTSLTPAAQRKIISEVIDEWSKQLHSGERRARRPTGFRARFSTLYGKRIRDAKANVFQQLPLTQGQSRKLTTIGHLIFERDWLWESYSGVVVAGYGDDDLFPAHDHITIEGFAANYLILNRLGVTNITRGMGASVRAFAQGDDVAAFMEGVSPSYRKEVEYKLHERLIDLPLGFVDQMKVSKAAKTKAIENVSKVGHQVYRTTLTELRAFRRDRFVNPVLAVVAALPMEDLAVMAETLVNLTSFRQKVSMSVETVGGPVDVAVISRGMALCGSSERTTSDLTRTPGSWQNTSGR